VRRLWLVCAAAAVMLACNSKSLKSGYCHTSEDCSGGKVCSSKYKCEIPDAGTDSAETGDARDAADGADGADAVDGRDGSGDASDASDASDVRDVPPPRCPQTIECADGGYDGSPGVCEADAGICVQCLQNSDCARDAKTPICDARLCRACKTDLECPAPQICMTDGHCATSGEVMFVEFNANGCPGANGSTTNPYCLPNDAVSHVALGKSVIIIRGPVADRMTLNTVALSPVIVGKNGASIPATTATAVQVVSDTILIRDLMVTGGTAATSKGIAVSGGTASLTLSNVQVTLGTGLGVQADTGALLTMDRCTVSGNNKGGILVDTANFDIKNSTVNGNGPGDDAGAAWGGMRLKNLLTTVKKTLELVTLMNNNQVGVSCSGSVDAMKVSVTGSAGGIEISSSCGFQSCGAPSATCGAPQ